MLKGGGANSDPVSLSLRYDGYAKALAFLAAMRTAGPDVVVRELNAMALTWQREIVRHMPVDNGLARASVQLQRAEMDSAGRITAAVGTNVDYVKYLEFGAEKARGLIKALSIWREGMEPIIHWYAKDMGIAELEAKRDAAKSDKSRANYDRRLLRANDNSTEEFAPPFRGSWQIIEATVVDRLRKSLARLMKQGRV